MFTIRSSLLAISECSLIPGIVRLHCRENMMGNDKLSAWGGTFIVLLPKAVQYIGHTFGQQVFLIVVALYGQLNPTFGASTSRYRASHETRRGTSAGCRDFLLC
jgi:hypothetical protein